MHKLRGLSKLGDLSYEEKMELNDQLCKYILDLRFGKENVIQYLSRVQENETPRESQIKRGVVLFYDMAVNSYYLCIPRAGHHKVQKFFDKTADNGLPVSMGMFGRNFYSKRYKRDTHKRGTVYSSSPVGLTDGTKLIIGGKINLTDYVNRQVKTDLPKQNILNYIKESNNV